MPMRSDYEDHARRVTARDRDGVFAYYPDDPSMSFPGVEIRPLDAPNASCDFRHAHIDERVAVGRFAVSDDMLAIEAIVGIAPPHDRSASALAEHGLDRFRPTRAGAAVEMRRMIHDHLAGVTPAAVRRTRLR